MLLRVLEITKVFVCILICMYIMLCSIISVRQQPNVALYVIRANKDILYCIVLHNVPIHVTHKGKVARLNYYMESVRGH